jgi:hypothetical protein
MLSTRAMRESFSACGLLFAAALVCASSAWAQFSGSPPADAAIILKLDGRVDVMIDSAAWALSAGNWVKPGQLIVTGPDSGATFKLADGSTFEIFANSHVTFRDSQGSWRDLLEVWLGNIRVHIQKLGGQPNYNRVHTPTALISVRGTTFEVHVEDNGDTTYVLVEEGLVDVENVSLPGGKTIPLSPGDSIRVYKNVPLAQNFVNKGAVAQHVARAVAQAAYEALLGRGRTSGTGSTSSTSTAGAGSGGGVGDTKAPAPPPAPPPPPPPSSGSGAPPPPSAAP